jgi:hypothetical protein
LGSWVSVTTAVDTSRPISWKASSAHSLITFTPGKRALVAHAPRGSTTVTSNSSIVAIGARVCAICTAPTMIKARRRHVDVQEDLLACRHRASRCLADASIARRAAETSACVARRVGAFDLVRDRSVVSAASLRRVARVDGFAFALRAC